MAEKLQFDIPLLLPDVPDAHDTCVDRLADTLREHDGVVHVHLVEPTDSRPAPLCIHYDPHVLALPRIRQQAERLGMVAVLIPATLFGLDMGPAVALHESSTLVVVLNALRLLAY